MKDAKAYIETGILELYVLGDISHDEKLEVEAMAEQHPTVKAELREIERSIELFAAEHAMEPNEDLRDRILNGLLTNFADDNTFAPSHRSVAEEAKVVTMTPPQNNFYKYAFAACLALLIASTVVLYNLYNRLEETNTRMLALSAQSQQYSNTVSMKEEQLKVFRDTSYRVFNLQGQGKTPDAAMSVAWSPNHKKVIIDLDGLNLPANDAEHQYQLWAIVDGKPVDLGVFDAEADPKEFMKVMKSVDKPQAFAVTLEKRGGVPQPTMANLTVIRAI
ncbi:anti-sigma factor [Mucilaginibacter myungsuensis]|uniref:Regulator of SigK n=1 Tax=Mucilaginibacter myungsuensis TaxID=649104 RepID=A0A929KVQ6_9SPHI|nr:anti-sigma factor [Mucilaginibacter myungsuensis]MBE9661318.1 anti-sigma factor [Mucilaginibacter myungsuensis]MDN3597461.1 anti-sigma factor [Mucilaginibacter myungsuensis]